MIRYERAIKIAQTALNWMTASDTKEEMLEHFYLMDLTDEEIEQLGYDWVLNKEEKIMIKGELMNPEIKTHQVTKEVIDGILNNQKGTEIYGEPYELLWYYDEKRDRYVGCDNVYRHAWMEEFDTKEECINWLLGYDEEEDDENE